MKYKLLTGWIRNDKTYKPGDEIDEKKLLHKGSKIDFDLMNKLGIKVQKIEKIESKSKYGND